MLSNVDGDVILADPSQADVFINDNDNANGVLSFRSPNFQTPIVQVNEDTQTDFSFTVRRSAGSFGTVSVNWEIVRNDSSSGDVNLDLTPIKGTVTFNDGERERPIIVQIVAESVPEPTEKFVLQLLPETATGGSKVEGITYGIVIIEDSDNVYGEVQFDVDKKQSLVMVSKLVNCI